MGDTVYKSSNIIIFMAELVNKEILMKQTFLILLVFLSFASYASGDTSSISYSNIEFSQSPLDLGKINAKFAHDIPYDIYDQTKFDIWLPESKKATGLYIFIHGGGFQNGDKSILYKNPKRNSNSTVTRLLSEGIAVATINYRLLKSTGETKGVIKCLNDSKRALQYIRSRAADFNINKEKIVLAGSSAGAGTALWIALNDDMKEPDSSDPVLRESTRVLGVAIRETQATYNIDKWFSDVFIDYKMSFKQAVQSPELVTSLKRFYGLSSIEEYNNETIQAYKAKVDMLALFTSDDPEIWAENTKSNVAFPSSFGIMYHHAFHVREIKEKDDEVGVENVCYYGKDPIIYEDSSNESYIDFVLRILK
ncbi:alpha/beta hydrolase [Puteibacter caeruleilacunae]|nr:alpha/beta hydrolase [Puteibacter caeruleilacunae]